VSKVELNFSEFLEVYKVVPLRGRNNKNSHILLMGDRDRAFPETVDISNNYCGAGREPGIDMIFRRCLVNKEKKRDRSDGRIRDAAIALLRWGIKARFSRDSQ
jgi:hypothetical protein